MNTTSGKYFDAVNPSNGEVFARIADVDTADVQKAISAARSAFDHGPWPQMSIGERGQFLLKIAALIREHAKELADLECASTGKTIKHTTFIDIPTAAETFEYFGNLPGKWIPACPSGLLASLEGAGMTVDGFVMALCLVIDR